MQIPRPMPCPECGARKHPEAGCDPDRQLRFLSRKWATELRENCIALQEKCERAVNEKQESRLRLAWLRWVTGPPESDSKRTDGI